MASTLGDGRELFLLAKLEIEAQNFRYKRHNNSPSDVVRKNGCSLAPISELSDLCAEDASWYSCLLFAILVSLPHCYRKFLELMIAGGDNRDAAVLPTLSYPKMRTQIKY